jgi:hypothetical protein
MSLFYREKRIEYGNLDEFLDLDIVPRVMEVKERTVPTAKHKRKRQLSTPKQTRQNAKRYKRHFDWLAHSNFSESNGDYYITLPYDDKHAPQTIEQANKYLKNFLAKVKRLYEKEGIQFKYMVVTEWQTDEMGEFVKRIHHHLLMSGGVDRSLIESKWSIGKGKNAERLGQRVNVQHIHADVPGTDEFHALTAYLTKQESRWKSGDKRYSHSNNLKKPTYDPRDSHHGYTKKKLEKWALSPNTGEDKFLKKYPDYDVQSIEAKWNDIWGAWFFYVKLKRKKTYAKKRRGPNGSSSNKEKR